MCFLGKRSAVLIRDSASREKEALFTTLQILTQPHSAEINFISLQTGKQ